MGKKRQGQSPNGKAQRTTRTASGAALAPVPAGVDDARKPRKSSKKATTKAAHPSIQPVARDVAAAASDPASVAHVSAPDAPAAPIEVARVEAAPLEVAPIEVARVEAAPIEVAPIEAAPAEVAPIEAAPIEVARVEAAPVEAAPVEAAPIEVARVEAAPVEVAPVVEAAPIVEAAPAASAASTAAAAPLDSSAPAAEAAPVVEAAPAVEAAPGAEAASAVAAAPAEAVAPVVEAEPVGAGAGAAPAPPEVARPSTPPASSGVPSGSVRLVLNFEEGGANDRTPPALSVDASAPSSRASDDDLQAFFAGAEAAVAREREAVLAELREELAPKAPPSPVQIERRHRARRLLTYVMGGAIVLLGLGSVRFALHEHEAEPSGSLSQGAPSGPDEPVAPSASVASVAAARSVASALPAPPRSAEAMLAQGLAGKADQSFERKRYREAIDFASRAVEAYPNDAAPYLIWAKALAETGQRGEAKRVFARCLERATEGPKGECEPRVR